MPSSTGVDLDLVAQDLGLPLPKVQRTVELLDAGNTVAFITRYRRDHTGGLDEEQIRLIHEQAARLRMLAERKQTILKSIESQGKLTPELEAQIRSATSTKRLEDLYLPYKPRKQTLATIARQRGLEPFAREILEASREAADLDARAADFVSPDRQLHSTAEVLHGVGHLLAERISERADLRSRLRKIFHRTGQLVSSRLESGERAETKAEAVAESTAATNEASAAEATGSAATVAGTPTPPSETPDPPAKEVAAAADDTPNPAEEAVTESEAGGRTTAAPEGAPEEATDGADATDDTAETADAPPPTQTAKPTQAARRPRGGKGKPASAKDRKRARLEAALKDYFDFREPIDRVPPHRVLAINRGERAKMLRVRIEGDVEAMYSAAVELLVPPDHPHSDFLRACVRDALQRLVLPSLEREIRRELTGAAEAHAVEVFVRNLRKLLLQPPIHGRRVLAIDPGFRSGCKLAALDEFGNVLDSGVVHVIGGEPQRTQSRAALAEMIRGHGISVVAIGNGTACRETELLVSETLAGEMQPQDVGYVIVNEAGASVYSTSPIGREELTSYDAVLRSAISIGRRLLDPLSELVKINPANIGVGLYQHDMKAKHLRDSLDAVVASCVNFVGVDVNTASPSLLRYVSGLNQLTARRLYDYRREHGPFRSRSQFLEVPGIGETTFIQAAGFLKITDGDNPLDATWIHPESYDIAVRVLEKLDSGVGELAGVVAAAANQGTATSPAANESPSDAPRAEAGTASSASSLVQRAARVDVAALAQELGIGELLLQDILSALSKPRRDPRDDLPPPLFRRGVMKLEDLKPGMELTGTVLNVVDFGAFVDIGIKESALVHISRLADHFVRDPHDVVSVGDILRVWVLEVDKERRRVSLTAVDPERRRAREASRSSGPRREKQRAAGGQAQGPAPAGRGQAARGGRTRGGKTGGKRRTTGPARPKAKPKPVKPITQEMVDGREPMRSFSDLIQFFEKKQDSDKDSSEDD